jgi:transcriptional regulator with XRE-family HTH domain
MENSKCSLKYRLYEAMAAKGKKAVDLTRDLQIPKSAISQYLSGKSQKMDSERLYKIAHYLDVSEPWLLGFDVPMERTQAGEFEERLDKAGTLAADVLMNPDLLKLVQHYMELEESDKNMVMMLVENLHQKTKKADT